ncbi:hypothetical protein, partial [Corynebacterium kroppenstedtii]|uniref:hypothetical protein n=1 Tax=Corynebacterium kroppenstedtii TaxID=161879 RepID=UPI0026EF4F68
MTVGEKATPTPTIKRHPDQAIAKLSDDECSSLVEGELKEDNTGKGKASLAHCYARDAFFLGLYDKCVSGRCVAPGVR